MSQSEPMNLGPEDQTDPPADARPAWRKKRVLLPVVAVFAFLMGVGAGAGDGGDTAQMNEARAEIQTLESNVAELEALLAESSEQEQAAAELDDRLAELESALEEAEARARSSEELAALEVELKEREAALAVSQNAPQAPAPAPAPATTAAGCQEGQVDINTASHADLQRIHQVGPARATQIEDLRPFRSVDDLTRVSGIGPSHLAAIKGQGLACVN